MRTEVVTAQADIKAQAGRALLLAIIGTGIALRLLGLGWGIPRAMAPGATPYRTSFHLDEYAYIKGVLSIKPETWNYDVRDYHWGTLQFYLIGGALKTARLCGYLSPSWKESFARGDHADIAKVYITGRAVSALTGILAVFAAFLLGRRLKDFDAGLTAAAFLSVVPLHVLNSHFLTSDITMVFLSLVSVYCFTVWLERGGVLPRVTGAFALGLAISAKYNSLFLLPIWLAGDIVYLWRKSHDGVAAWKAYTLGYGAMVAGFALGEPYAFIHMPAFIDTIHRAYFSSSEAVRAATLPWPRLLFEQMRALSLFGMQWTVAIPACVGILFCLVRPTKQRLALGGFILMTFASLAFARWPMIRYTLPLIALAAVAAALFLADIRLPPASRPFVTAALCALPLAVSWAQVRIMLDEHPANRASEWIAQHIPAGSRVGQIWPEMPPLDRRRYDLHQLHGLFGSELAGAEDLDRDYLILDNLPIQRFNSEFLDRLARDYLPVAEFHTEPHVGPWELSERDAPHDWKYTHPAFTIYERKRTGVRSEFHQIAEER